MQEKENINVEKLAADTLLERGVAFSITAPFLFRLFGKKKITLVVKQPYLGTLYRISRLYLGMNIKPAQLEEMTHDEAYKLLSEHLPTVALIAAHAALNDYWKGKLFGGLLARLIMRYMKPADLQRLFYVIVLLNGVNSFTNTIRLTATMKTTAPRNLSPEEKGS